MAKHKTPQERIDAYLAKPSLKAWRDVYCLCIPDTGLMGRTMWQAWITVDGGAPTQVPADAGFTSFPDAFTMRRGLRAAREGKIPVGLQSLETRRAPIVPR